jgi:hypothetical protein
MYKNQGDVLTTVLFLCNLQMDPISCQAFPALCNVTMGLLGPFASYKKWIVVNSVTGSIFTTIIFLRNLQMDPISLSICQLQAFQALCNVTLQLIGLILRLQRKLIVVNTVPVAIFTPLYFLCNLEMGQVNDSICTWQVFQD